MQTFRKGKLYSVVTDPVAHLFDGDDAHYVTVNDDELEEGECVIYIKSHRGGWPSTLWCYVLTKFGIREIRKECLKKEI